MLGSWREADLNGFMKQGHKSFLCPGTALVVLDAAEFFGHLGTFIGGHWVLFLLGQAGNEAAVIAKILLESDQNCSCFWAVMSDFWIPLLATVVKRCRRNNAIAQEEAVSLWVAERPESIVFLLSGCVPQPKVVAFALKHDVA